MTTIIGADIGKYQTRIVASFIMKYLHSSRMIRYDDTKITHDLGKDDFLVEYNGEKFYVGNFAKREGKLHIQYRDASKVHFTTLINLLCGLSRLPDDRFKVVLNTPISQKSPKEIEELKDLVRGRHTFTVNGTRKDVFVEDVGVWVEGAAGFFSQPRSGVVQGFDFGSTTTNVFQFEDKYFINSKSLTIPYGMENLESDPQTFMESVYSHISHDFQPQFPTMVLGGGYHVMFQTVKEYFPNAYVLDDPIFATAIGLYKVAKRAYGI